MFLDGDNNGVSHYNKKYALPLLKNVEDSINWTEVYNEIEGEFRNLPRVTSSPVNFISKGKIVALLRDGLPSFHISSTRFLETDIKETKEAESF